VARSPGGRVTVRAIAAEAGVSIATVSRVMNGHVPVAPDTRELVRRAVERLGARPPARSGSAEGAVYVHCPYVLTDYFGLIVSSIAETLDLHGRRLLLGAGRAAGPSTPLAALPDDPAVAGAILILPPEPSAELEDLRTRGLPFAVIDPMTPLHPDIAAVSAAHAAGARNVTAHLTGLGHRRIGIINGPGEWLASHSRMVGHTSALAETGTLPDPDLIRRIEPTAEHGYKAACELFDLPPRQRPTALVAFNDKAATGALRAAYERGLRVPEDLSITGFDDLDLGRSTQPMITTVRQPLEEMGRIAVSLLMRLVDRHTIDTLHVELATQLIIRGSTGPVPENAAV
jgi:LacI family transcriptional regulator